MSVDWTADDATLAAALRAFGVETDLEDAELASKARGATGEITKRLGPRIGAEVFADGRGRRFIALDPPATTVTEITEDGVAVAADDNGYRLRPGGVLLERLSGSSPSVWRGTVHVTYDQGATDDTYDRVVSDLVKLSLEFSGLDARRDGDYSEESVGARSGGQLGYQELRDGLISELTAGMWLR